MSPENWAWIAVGVAILPLLPFAWFLFVKWLDNMFGYVWGWDELLTYYRNSVLLLLVLLGLVTVVWFLVWLYSAVWHFVFRLAGGG